MPYPQRHPARFLPYALLFPLLQFILHLMANNLYGFHRDELLYLALGQHLDWGYKEVPVFIGAMAWFVTHTIGDSLFCIRFFPALFSAMIVLLSCLTVTEMGGRRLAVLLCGLALTFSPAFLASGYLFQPVVFDQFWWVLSAYFMLKYFRNRRPVFLYGWGLACGFGMLTKYTMAFYMLAILLAIASTPQRKLFLNKHFWLSCLVALIVFSPNLYWQISHNFPVLRHMQELRQTQLEHISMADFLAGQIISHGTGVLLFGPGFTFLLFTLRLKNYRFLALALLFTLALLIIGKGKVYYAFGAYPLLFSAGGYACERIIKSSLKPLRWAFAIMLLLPNLFFVPLVLPILPIKKALPVLAHIRDDLHFSAPFIWEDQKEHPLTQDYADMFGWDELAQKTAKFYHALPDDVKRETIIFASNYGQAGAIDYFGKKLDLPHAVSLNSSFAIWAPEKIQAKNMIYIDDSVDFAAAVKFVRKIAETTSPYAREKHTGIYFIQGISPALEKRYREEWLRKR